MDYITLKSTIPESIGEYHFNSKEYCQYLYLPVIFAEDPDIYLEPRLEFLRDMIHDCTNDYIINDFNGSWWEKYVYLTIKQTFIPKDVHHNRPGFHSDGFLTDDVQYIWFDKYPTEFMIGNFNVPKHDELSMVEFNRIEKLIEQNKMSGYLHRPEPFNLYRLDQNHIHRTTPATENSVRTFIKITFSDKIYAQEGNSINYLVNYNWDYSARKEERNQPHSK